MSVGLLALLDDVAALAKVAAASLDDVVGQAARAGTKTAGVVIDDAAVAPGYVTGFEPARELPIIRKIAVGSLKNKLIFLLPAAVALGYLAPWAITPLLMLGGCYLSYEGAEKVYEAFVPHKAHAHEAKLNEASSAKSLEDRKVAGAIKTDFILSAEIMAITLNEVSGSSVVTQGVVLAVVGLFITLIVYGAVAIIVKADDVGVAMAGYRNQSFLGTATRGIGRGLVVGMPYFLRLLKVVGTAAMIWVGGGIIVHALAGYGCAGIEHFIEGLAEGAAHAVPAVAGILHWLVTAAGSGVVGLVLGLALIPIVGYVLTPTYRWATSLRD